MRKGGAGCKHSRHCSEMIGKALTWVLLGIPAILLVEHEQLFHNWPLQPITPQWITKRGLTLTEAYDSPATRAHRVRMSRVPCVSNRSPFTRPNPILIDSLLSISRQASFSIRQRNSEKEGKQDSLKRYNIILRRVKGNWSNYQPRRFAVIVATSIGVLSIVARGHVGLVASFLVTPVSGLRITIG